MRPRRPVRAVQLLRRVCAASAMLGRAVVVAAAAVVLVVAAASAAGAHASLVTSSPAAGADLAAAPGVVTLRFSEPLIEELSSVTVTDPTGRSFTAGPTGERDIAVNVDSTAQGTYTVEWKTVSPIDGHTLRGGFEFGVGSDVGAQAAPSDAPSAADVAVAAARVVEYVGLLGVLGLLSLAALAGGVGLSWIPRGLHRWVAAAAAGGVATVTGEVLLASTGAIGPTLRAFLSAPSGLPRAARLLAEVAAVAITWRSARRGDAGWVSDRPARTVAGLLALASLGLLATAGHAAAWGQWGILAGTGHLWAAGVWAGALLVMALQSPPGGWRGEIGRRLIGELTPVALTAFVATVLLGSVRGAQELASPSDLWSTAYGQVLSAKLVLVAAMVPLSVLAWRRRPRSRTEGLLALGAVLAAAALAAFPVPPGRVGDDAAHQDQRETQGLPQQGDLTIAKAAGDTVVGLSLRPAEPGLNDLYVHLVPPGGPEDADGMEVTVAIDDADPTAMGRCGTACRTLAAPLDGGETLHLDVSGRQGGTATIRLPALPAPDGTDLARALTVRMRQLDSYRYEETFGPVDPPIRSSWAIHAPDRLHGITRRGEDDYSEIIRIGERRWTRRSPDGRWTAETGGAPVEANRFIWDYDGKTAAHIVGHDTLDGIDTRIVSFHVDVYGTAIWYRLWVDDDDLVRKAQMRAQGHFMDRRYHDLDTPLDIQPPTDDVADPEE